MAVDTLFQNAGSGGGSNSSQYVKDNFQDDSNAANSNTGFSSTVSTNPLGAYFQNDDCPRYGLKTLFVKDLVLIEDRTKWINDKPTYQVVWSEDFPAAKGYVYGNVRLRNLPQGKCVEVRNIGDGFGVGGVIRQVAWLLNETAQTGTAQSVTDGSNDSTLTFGSSASTVESNGVNQYIPILHTSSLQTQNIHDYQLKANQYLTLRVSGVVVYFENATTNIDCFPGNTYVDKTLVTTTAISALALPTISGRNGARSVISKTAAGTYQLTTVETPSLATVATGSSGTNLLNVTTGQGGSFPIGSGIVQISGTSFYVGSVTNQSTDTLTVFPTLAFGLSGAMYKAWYAGPTIAISATLYSLKTSLDFTMQSNLVDALGLGATTGGVNAYSSPELNYRIWGRNLSLQAIDGYQGLGFLGNTAAFMQLDGDFAAAELEFSAAGILNATLAINGVPAWGINEGATGVFKKTVFSESGPGWNSLNFTPGQSYISAVLTKINLYERKDPVGVTVGVLAAFDSLADRASRGSISATFMDLGRASRVYSDNLYLTGNWVRGTSHTLAGGVGYYGATTACVMNFRYYGTDFGVIGTEGGSMAMLLDGASIAYSFNVMKSVTTLGWHTVGLTWQAGATAIVNAVDYIRPNNMEFKNRQKFVPLSQLLTIPKTFVQSDTPRNSKDGDLWLQNKATVSNFAPTIWLKFLGVWNRIQINQISDDPNLVTFVRTHGSSTGADAGGVQDGELFNLFAWQAATASTLGARCQASSSDTSFLLNHTVVDGINTAGSNAALTNYFNKIAWSAFTGRGTSKAHSSSANFNFNLYSNKGTTTTSDANGTTACDKWNGSAWSTPTAWGTAAIVSGAFVQNSILYVCGGVNTAGTNIATVETRNVADTIAGGTAVPATCATRAGSAQGTNGLLSNVANIGTATTNNYVWSGAAWSSAITSTYSSVSSTQNGQASITPNRIALKNGGSSADTSGVQNNTESYNGAAYTAGVTSSTSRNRGVGSAI